MTQEKSEINRPLVGILSVVCLLSALVLWAAFPHDPGWNPWKAGFMRVGLVLAAFWIALPSRDRPAAWANMSSTALIGLMLAVVAVAIRPNLVKAILPIAIAIAIIGYFLKPRQKKRPGK